MLFSNKEIRIEGKPFFLEGMVRSIRTIKDLLDKNGNVLSFPVFQSKYSLQRAIFFTFTKLFLLFQVSS